MILTVLIFIVLLGILVLVHEWGHFFVARKFGIRVDEFAFGFPPRIASFVKNGTRYALNLVPLGGYVKIYGESGEGDTDPTSFSSRPIYQRVAVIVAGVVMNVILAWFLFSAGHTLGLPAVVGDEVEGGKVSVIGIAPDSPAAVALLHVGDTIVAVGTESEQFQVTTIEEVQEFIDQHRGMPIMVEVERGTETNRLLVTPRLDPPSGEGPLGIAMARVGIIRSPLWRAPLDGARTTYNAFISIAISLGNALKEFVVQQKVPADIGGPVAIFVATDEMVQLGLAYLVMLAAGLSASLALFNVLPIPGLDGGRILFLFLEKIRRAPINQRYEQLAHTMGIVVLLILIALITYRDVVRIF